MINKIEQNHMLAAAGYRCEYCRRDLMGEVVEFDHIIPQAIDGLSIKSNFAVSCNRCNRNKGKRTHYVDPHTRITACLFNPRMMDWESHFHHIDGEVVGKTVEGRATAALLFRSTPKYSPPDLSWNKLESIARNDFLYRFLNHLRYLRLQNQFDILSKLLKNLPESIEVTKEELEISNTIRNFLQLELYFTRGKELDIANGIYFGESLLNSEQDNHKEDLRCTLSILYQQRATSRFNSGDIIGARQDQKRSYELYTKIDNNLAKKTLFSSHEKMRQYLRSVTIENKYNEISLSKIKISDILLAAIDLYNDRDFSHFTYLIDLVLITDNVHLAAIESLYSIITNLLEVGGYGTNIDMAKLITLRRRWWVLHCLVEVEIWWDAFRGDLTFWKEVNMFNEIRELLSSFKRMNGRMQQQVYKDAVFLIAEFLI